MTGGSSDRARLVVAITLALALAVFAVQLLGVRPYLWPAGVGLSVSGDMLLASVSEPRTIARIRPPDLGAVGGQPVVVTAVEPGGVAARAGVEVGTPVAPALAPDAALRLWRDMYRRGPAGDFSVVDRTTGREVVLTPAPVWRVDPATRGDWLRLHVGATLQSAAFILGAVILVALGSRGVTATLVTLALLLAAIANAGPLFGAELKVTAIGPLLLLFGWLATALSFPVIGLALLHFPSRAPILDRQRWIYVALVVLPAPVFVISLTAAAFLLGVDAALPALTWFATNGWLFDLSFAAALAGNVLIVVEGIYRYRTIVEPNERRRIQIVVYTGVPSVFAYAIKAGVPLVSSLAGQPVQLPWLIEGLLLAIVILPAFTLPYAVAIKHVFSPRTVLRRSLQYALARRTLSFLVLLPIAALVVSFVSQRDRPLSEIILGQPLFYIIILGLIVVGMRYRDQAQRALDKKFFRAEYDAREILVALANRVPLEHDPAELMGVVVSSIDNALHPECLAVLAEEESRFAPLASLRTTAAPLARSSGIVTLLCWSEEPLEVFLDDERSPARRLPADDRAWLAASGITLLVPVFAGTTAGDARTVVGIIALGQKRSEEPYTAEDRKLLGGIATQLSVALDLSRLRKRAAPLAAMSPTTTPTLTPSMVAGRTTIAAPSLVMCATCHRCYDLAAIEAAGRTVCPADGTPLQPVIGMPPIVDAKYRVDAVVGRGGMGAVFRAYDLRLERDVAIKVVRAELVTDPESRARFQREAQIVARLQHPSIVTVFDYGALPGGAAFLVMEYVRGEDLRHTLKREKRLPAARTVDLISAIASGVDAAHRVGVLHRDLKPENILLPDDGAPKVLDFGVAKITETPGGFATQAVTVIGTPAYMAPEQLRGEPLDPRADVYSLAVITYEALTGRLPFGTGSLLDIGIKQASGPEGLSFDDVPPALAGTLRRALSLRRDERPATARQFADELARPGGADVSSKEPPLPS